MSSLLDRTRTLGTSGLSSPAVLKRGRSFTTDNFMTFDDRWATIDSTGAFLIGELERLDQTLHDPLIAVTWARDISLREDVSMADEVSSFTNSAFSSPGGIVPGGISWISKGKEVKYTLPELASAQKLGRPVDAQKYDAMKLAWQMDVDQLVYIGDILGGGFGYTGLVNNAGVTVSNVATGAAGSTLWSTKTPDEILADVNTLLTNTYITAGYAIVPSKLLLPPVQWSYIVSQKVSSAGNVSILEFLRNNSMCNAANGRPLDIMPVKWLSGRGVGGANRMVAYTQDKDRVRYPLVPLQRTPIEFRGIYQLTYYYGRLGQMEVVYPETLGYGDGL